MALAISPGAILLDEPFSNLDPVMVKDIRGETRELISQAGITTIIATHDWEDAFLLGQKVGLILGGRLMVLRDDGLPENGDEEAMGYLKDLRVIRGRVENGMFIAAGISIPAKVPDGECRALVTGESITLLPL
jgi:ABC-type sulfate/molybdate transport systems ATPase subunit